MTTNELLSCFENPPAYYRGKPFWSWNGRLNRSELLRQVHVFQRMGMGGFFMHSRTGLATEYLGDEWFELINACADEAEQLGMEAWLYDEDRWPSGTAGGLVTAEPRFRMQYLRMEINPAQGLSWTEDVLAAFTCRLNGLACSQVARLPRGQTVPRKSDETLLVFRVVTQRCSSTYNGYTYVNTMNAEATQRFIELTHEQYAQRCGARLGLSIPGIFTDEPHRGALMDPFSEEGEVAAVQVPWTEDLPDRFKEAFGYDLLDRLPELYLQPDGRPVSQVKWHFVELLMRLFLERFAAPYERWCREHGLLVTGHVLHEDSLAAQTAMCGSVMRYYEFMDVPGIDILSEGNQCYWVAKQLQSAATQLGRRLLLSELYGCTGWQMPFKGHKAVGDWQALFGINLRCHHLSWYTMEGEAKRDYPASIFHQSAWWRLYRYVEDYFSRLGVFLDQGVRQCRLLVIHPVESVWCQVHPGWARHLAAQTEPIRALERRFAELFHWLQGAQVDFDYGDEAMLASMGEVTDEGRFRVGQACYDAVLVGGLLTVRSTTLALLNKAVRAGVPVIFAGAPPEYVDAERGSAAKSLAERCLHVPWEKSAVAEVCARAAGGVVSVSTGAGEGHADSVFCQVRRDEAGHTYLMVLNTDRERAVPRASIRVRAQGPVQRWDCWTGKRYAVPFQEEDGWIVLETTLEPAGERTYVFGFDSDGLPVEHGPEREVQSVPIPGPFRYRLSEPNVCVLDMCEYRLADGPWEDRIEVLKADRAVRGALGLEPRGGYMVQPWLRAREPQRVLSQVTVRFRFNVEAVPQGPCWLAVERPDVFRVSLNGTHLPPESSAGHWVDICFVKLPVPDGCLVLGENVVEMTCGYREDIGLEAVYLLGDFGVRVEGSKATLTKLPEVLHVGDLAGQGFPFYGGAITYELDIAGAGSSLRGDLAYYLATPGLSAACALVVPSGHPIPDTSSLHLNQTDELPPSEHVIAWDPWEARLPERALPEGVVELHVYLTRRNTFGPLHQVPREAPSYGPWNWITEGDHFSEAYMLWPAGLLSPPEIRTVKQGA